MYLHMSFCRHVCYCNCCATFQNLQHLDEMELLSETLVQNGTDQSMGEQVDRTRLIQYQPRLDPTLLPYKSKRENDIPEYRMSKSSAIQPAIMQTINFSYIQSENQLNVLHLGWHQSLPSISYEFTHNSIVVSDMILLQVICVPVVKYLCKHKN